VSVCECIADTFDLPMLLQEALADGRIRIPPEEVRQYNG
jgi:hypothetical protein